MKKMAVGYASGGVTTVMPTLASAPLEEMMRAVALINSFESDECAASFCGVHLEGRYLNAAKRGAHAANMLSALEASELDAPELRDCAALHISAAYELDDGSFAKKAIEIGATLALAHTAATYAEAKEAERRGVSAYSHLFNAMPPIHHRDGGAVVACLTGDAYGELICDGIHIAPETVALAYKCKRERLSLVSDSMEATGMPDGEYSIAGNPVTVKDGKALTHDGALAGSTLTLDKAVNNLMSFCDIPLSEAILCATEAPAKEVGIFDVCGSLDEGKRADIIIAPMDEKSFRIEKIMLRGRFI
jgi:N-acetylglucosamine-6-phosphate deacetylase